MSTLSRRLANGATAKKRAYHHGDLERALVETAVRMIQDEGVQALTLRGVGARLGVSRTALYRHFDDKQALLARVASEGFKRFHEALAAAVARAANGRRDPMPAMAAAYLRFARANPSHYQTMFSGVLTDWTGVSRSGPARRGGVQRAARHHPPRAEAGTHSSAGDPIELAEITWAMSHGIATLGMAQPALAHARPRWTIWRCWAARSWTRGLRRKIGLLHCASMRRAFAFLFAVRRVPRVAGPDRDRSARRRSQARSPRCPASRGSSAPPASRAARRRC